MAKPIPTTLEGALGALSRKVDDLGRHTHPGLVGEPVEIVGDRSSDTVAILTQLLAALDAASIITDNTTG
jgi:hypothetical protein